MTDPFTIIAATLATIAAIDAWCGFRFAFRRFN